MLYIVIGSLVGLLAGFSLVIVLQSRKIRENAEIYTIGNLATNKELKRLNKVIETIEFMHDNRRNIQKLEKVEANLDILQKIKDHYIKTKKETRKILEKLEKLKIDTSVYFNVITGLDNLIKSVSESESSIKKNKSLIKFLENKNKAMQKKLNVSNTAKCKYKRRLVKAGLIGKYTNK